MAVLVRDLKDLPEVHAPIPGMKPPVSPSPPKTWVTPPR